MSAKNDRMNRRPIQPLFSGVAKSGVGAAPGSPIYIGDRVPTESTYSLIQYDRDSVSVIVPDTVEEIMAMQEPGMVNWINVNGLGDADDFKRLCAYFRIDPLTQEDLMNTKHRPKMEEFGDYVLVIVKMLRLHEFGAIEYEQVGCILTGQAVITFQEAPGDCFDPVRERLKTGSGRLRKLGSDYLLYALLDVIVDNYFAALESLGTRLEGFEDTCMSAREASTFMAGLQNVKSELNHMRRIIWPVRDTVSALLHAESTLLDTGLQPYLRDLYENVIQILEALESYRETASGIQEVFLSSLSNRMNEVMKVLTIISTIFIPLTFIAGVYGMNFRHMPELESHWGYPAAWAMMVAIAGGLILYFKRKKWL